VSLPQIRDKLRVNIVNALRSVFAGGPEAREETTWQSGMVLSGFDPVAVDTVCLDKLNRHRRTRLDSSQKPLPYIDADPAMTEHLRAASQKGLGCCQLHSIRILERLF